MLVNQFQKPLKLMKLCLLLSGIKVNENKASPVKQTLINSVYYANLIILYTVIFAEIYWVADGILIGRDFVEMCLTAPCITISILGTLKAAPLFFKKDIVCNIIDTLKNIHPSKNNDETELISNVHDKTDHRVLKINDVGRENDVKQVKENIEEKLSTEAFKMLRIVEFLLTLVSISVLVMFLLAPLGLMFWGYFESGEIKIKYPFSVKYWFDAYEVKLWPLIYFHQVWATIIVCVNIFGTEVLFYAVCTYLEMHFRILCHNFENIHLDSRLHEKLKIGLKRHQVLIHLVEQMETLFSIPVLLHIVSSSFLICLSAFNITVAEDLGSVFAFITFLVLSLSQVSLLCFFGDMLMKSSAEVSGGIYKCPWYHFENDTKKAVLIIIMRAQKPCKLTACNFADVNLSAFTTILSRSWSYFALLKTVYK